MPYSSQFAIINKIKNIVRKTGRLLKNEATSGISEAIARKIQKSACDVMRNPNREQLTPPYIVIAEQLQSQDPTIFRAAVFYLSAIAVNEPKTTDNIIEILNKCVEKSNNGKEQLELWNNELCTSAALIVRKRLTALDKLRAIASGIYASIAGSGEELEIKYGLKTSGDFILEQEDKNEADWKDFYLQELKARQALDILRGNTSIGPHRDDLFFYVNGRLLKAFGSQGQQRSAALALKLAQLEYVKNAVGEYPVLLLDDVLAELDKTRQNFLLKSIGSDIQTIITSVDILSFEKEFLKDVKIYKVKDGKIDG